MAIVNNAAINIEVYILKKYIYVYISFQISVKGMTVAALWRLDCRGTSQKQGGSSGAITIDWARAGGVCD